MDNILITGGAGFIGSNLAKKLSNAKNRIFVIDDLSMGNLDNLSNMENLEFIECSVLDRVEMEDVFKNNQFKYIYHLAAIASVADSVARPIETHNVNFDSTIFIIELIKKYQKKLEKIIFSSSAAIYGDDETLPKSEKSTVLPLTPYAVDKFASERYILNAFKLYGIKSSATRFFNVYGINQNPNSPYSGVISILVNKYLEELKGNHAEFLLYGDGEQTRDFIYVDDVANALIHIAKSNEAIGNVYNVGNGREISLNEIKATLDKIFDINLGVKKTDRRDGDIDRSFADITKLRSIGFYPSINLYQGLEKYTQFEKERIGASNG